MGRRVWDGNEEGSENWGDGTKGGRMRNLWDK